MQPKIISLLFIAAVLAASCSTKKEIKPPTPMTGQTKIMAVYLDTNGIKYPAIVMRVIQKTIKYDSLKAQDVIVYDTLFGVERTFPQRDNAGNIITDSAGKPKYFTGIFSIGKDSVNTHVENIPLDSLLKK